MPDVRVFVLEPVAGGSLPDRVAACVRSAESRGLALVAVRIAFVALPHEVPEGSRVRGWLKRVLRRQGMRARWPGEDQSK